MPISSTPQDTNQKFSETLRLPDNIPTLSWLVALQKPHRGELYQIKQNGLTLGRAEENDIVLDDEQCSRNHARLMVEPGIGNPQVYIQDAGSANGTFVNAQRVVRQLLQDEDRITLGQSTFVFKQL